MVEDASHEDPENASPNGRAVAAKKRAQGGAGYGFLTGLLLASALTVAYVRLGYQLPSWVQPRAKVEGLVKSLAADLATDAADPEQLQRLVATQIGLDGARYIQTDNALGGLITAEYIWHNYTKREIQQLRATLTAIETARPNHQALSKPFDRALEKELDPLVDRYLHQRFPATAPESETERRRRLRQQLLVTPMPLTTQDPPLHHAPITFRLGQGGATKVTLQQGDDIVRTLLEGELPPGLYHLAWDLVDDDGQLLPAGSEVQCVVAVAGHTLSKRKVTVPGK